MTLSAILTNVNSFEFEPPKNVLQSYALNKIVIDVKFQNIY